MRERRLLRRATAILATLAVACGPRSDNAQRDAANAAAIARNRPPSVDTCEVAGHPERVDGRRVRLRAIVIQDIEFAYLTARSMGRWCDRNVVIGQRSEWASSEVDRAVMDSRRLSTATRTLAAEAEFEGIIRARPNALLNDPRVPRPAFEATIEVEKADHVRLIELPRP